MSVDESPRELPRWMEHDEADEVTCICGWEAPGDDYEQGRLALAAHIRGEDS